MNPDITEVNDKQFSELLHKSTPIIAHKTFSSQTMNRIAEIAIRQANYKKYVSRSWFFLALSVIFSFLGFFVFHGNNQPLGQWINHFIPGIADAINLLMVVAISGLLFYELNLLSGNLFRKTTIKAQGKTRTL